MNEQDLLGQIAEAGQTYQDAKKKLAEAKKKWVKIESLVIETKITLERLQEQLVEYRNTTPTYLPDAREREIQGFRDRLPHLLEKIKDEDIKD
jgi:hypothetical protein